MNRDKQRLIAVIALPFLLFAVTVVLQYAVANRESRIARTETLLREIADNRAALTGMAESTKTMKKKAEDGKGRNFVTEMEKTAADTGLAKNLKKINFVIKKKEGAYTVDDYEVRLEGVDINSAVNFIYRLTGGATLIKVKKCTVTVGFDSPSALNIQLLVSHIS